MKIENEQRRYSAQRGFAVF